jgi:L-aspartate oxidase
MKWEGKIMDIYTDVLIVGTGVSGLFCALNLDEALKITIITKSKVKESNTYLAQGGISTARNMDDIPVYIEDTLKAGKYKNDINAVNVLVRESNLNIKKILELGVKLDYQGDELSYTKEAAHSISRIVHAKDETGKAVIDALYDEILKRKNITVYENTYMVDLIAKDNTCYGITALRDNIQINIHSKISVLATGGIGGIFKNSTNQRHITADGIYAAMSNNIKLSNLEYIQFHPTAFYDGKRNEKRFLISESIRGEGGKLVNYKGEQFVDELLPRDVVSKAVMEEMQRTGATNVFLDVSSISSNYLKSRFPHIYNECLKAGIDITKDLIPVSPAQHYFMGGIDVDLNSKTTMGNLYAVGEVTCTGVHGANRLASNSLLEGLVFSRRAATAISKEICNIKIFDIAPKTVNENIEIIQAKHLNTVLDMFERKVGTFVNELVNHR